MYSAAEGDQCFLVRGRYAPPSWSWKNEGRPEAAGDDDWSTTDHLDELIDDEDRFEAAKHALDRKRPRKNLHNSWIS